MNRACRLAVIVLGSAASSAGGQTPPQSTSGIKPHAVLTQMARWSESPTPAELEAAYPRGAPAGGGMVNLECFVKPDGRLKACAVQAEMPDGAGFGQAALSLMPRFRVEARDVQDQPPVAPALKFSLTLKLPGDPVHTPCLLPSCVWHPAYPPVPR